MDANKIADMALWLPAFLLSVTIHEAAHAWLGIRGGDYTAEEQATLNPMPHIRREPVGMILAPIVSFWFWNWTLGWGSAPYDPLWASRHPRRAALMSAAGPISNFLLAGIVLAAIHILLGAGVFELNRDPKTYSDLLTAASSSLGFAARILSILFMLNVLLGIFNLIPVPPLDGSGVVMGLWPNSAVTRMLEGMQEGGWGFLGLLIAIAIFNYAGWPLVKLAINYGIYGKMMFQVF